MIYTFLNGVLLLPTFGIYQGYLSRLMMEAHNLKIKQQQDEYLKGAGSSGSFFWRNGS
jgi:hypothetical protein